MTLIRYGWFASHSGFQLPWKVDCDALSDDDLTGLAKIIRGKFAFSQVVGVPRGGTRLAKALAPYAEPLTNYPTLIIDDVLTTGQSIQEMRTAHGEHSIGVVIFARGPCPNWVWPIFTVNEWAQSRGTGLG